MKKRGQLIFSENISTGQQGNIISNPILSVTVPAIPSLLSLAITIVTYFEEELKSFHVELILMDKKSKKEIFKIEKTEINLPMGSTHTNFVLNADIRNANIISAGTIVAECTVNDFSFTEELEVMVNG